MKRKLIAIIFFLLMISIFIGYINTEEDKKVILIGKAVILNQEIKVEENGRKFVIPTISGRMGIITAVDSENSKYVAFGHGIPNIEDKKTLEQLICYDVENISVEKSNEQIIGSLSANIKENERIGNVIQNKATGVSGIIDNIDDYCKDKREVYICSKYRIRRGPATIYLDLYGNGAKEYDVYIKSINYREDIENIKLRITDQELLENTGGIIKGMSGTPVLQNGKLIGAINSVTLYDNAEGYATFASTLFE